MPYELAVDEWYCISAAWFYCRAQGMDHEDEQVFAQALAGTGEQDADEGVLALVRPHLAHVGFPLGTYYIKPITERYVDYRGFPLTYGEHMIVFEPDALFHLESQYPDSETTVYSEAAKALLVVLGLDGPITAVTVITASRIEGDEEVDEEEDE